MFIILNIVYDELDNVLVLHDKLLDVAFPGFYTYLLHIFAPQSLGSFVWQLI